jgi:hypothetical protein
MLKTDRANEKPTLHQDDCAKDLKQRNFDLCLARIEATIRKKNKSKPMPYPLQLPSLIPNSSSI